MDRQNERDGGRARKRRNHEIKREAEERELNIERGERGDRERCWFPPPLLYINIFPFFSLTYLLELLVYSIISMISSSYFPPLTPLGI